MQKTDCIVITGAAGFIGSVMVGYLNSLGYDQLILVDDFSHPQKEANLADKRFLIKVERQSFFSWLSTEKMEIHGVLHLGARTDTTLMDKEIFDQLNVSFSQQMWQYCSSNNIPLVYASSAATYGGGEHGYKDDESLIPALKPLNPYGDSKQFFDVWALAQNEQPPYWAGLKFFNVYGPNEYHKGRMASVIMHAYNNLAQNQGNIKLFRSHHADYVDGGQMRDFIYVKDVVKVAFWLLSTQKKSGIYNLGTGQARSFNDLAKGIFKALKQDGKIEYIDTPLDIRDKYQYFTEADMAKLKLVGYEDTFTTLEEGIEEYISEYLEDGKLY